MTTHITTPKPPHKSNFKVSFNGELLNAWYNSQYETLHISNGHTAYWEFVDTIYDQTKIIELI